MLTQDPKAEIASYEDYLATYFPNRTTSATSVTTPPSEVGVQLAIESLEKHSETLRDVTNGTETAEQDKSSVRGIPHR